VSNEKGEPAGALPVAIGELVAGKYRVQGLLGRGARGVVVAALELAREREVAIKFVEGQTELAAARFLREVHAAAQVESEHVTRVFEVGRLEHGAPFMVMERLEGENLAQVIGAGPVPLARAAGYGLEACEALGRAHAARIVHRALKPQNLFLHTRKDKSRVLKLLGLGVSTSLEGAAATESQPIVGAPEYLAPEQIESPARVDPRTDIWALGALLYELVGGERLFRGATMAELCMNILSAPVPPLRAELALPEGFEPVLRRCLARDMSERFASVGELAQALAPFADDEHARLAPVVVRALAGPGAELAPSEDLSALELRSFGERPRQRAQASMRRTARSPRRLLLSLVLVGVMFYVLQSRSTQEGCTRFGRRFEVQTSTAPAGTATSAAAAPRRASSGALEPSDAPAALASSELPSTIVQPAAVSTAAPASARRVKATAPQLAPTALPSPSAEPALEPPSCRVLELSETGKPLAPGSGRVAFEWARRLCTRQASPGGQPYRLSDSGISVQCVCD
jgi:serine/threonine-protein kinase